MKQKTDKNKNNNEINLEIIISAVEKYLSARLYQFGIVSFGFKNEIKEEKNLIILSQEIKSENMGIFNFALNYCELQVRINLPQKENDNILYPSAMVSCKLSYIHFNGGQNSCDLNIKLFVTTAGEVMENYK